MARGDLVRSAWAEGGTHGTFIAMKTTIDHSGRLVIPKDIRRESGIKPGMPLEVRWEKGAIAITPAPSEPFGAHGRANPKSTAQRTVG
jgi:AbrB family looped-hinge helix DNA binding protein